MRRLSALSYTLVEPLQYLRWDFPYLRVRSHLSTTVGQLLPSEKLQPRYPLKESILSLKVNIIFTLTPNSVHKQNVEVERRGVASPPQPIQQDVIQDIDPVIVNEKTYSLMLRKP